MNELLKDGQQWAVHHGDCISHMLERKDAESMPAESVDFAIFSPPFPFAVRIHRFRS
jgi:hypothetical protein